jgi:hypothetical protein
VLVRVGVDVRVGVVVRVGVSEAVGVRVIVGVGVGPLVKNAVKVVLFTGVVMSCVWSPRSDQLM